MQFGAVSSLAHRLAGSAVADLSTRTKLELTGVDARRFLHNLCTNDIKKLNVGSGCEAFLLDDKGRIVDYVRAFCQERSFWLDAEPGRAEVLLAHLDRYLITEDVQLTDRTAELGQLHLTGARAGELLANLLGEPPVMANLEHRSGAIAGGAVQLRRCDRGPLPGFDLLAEADAIDPLRETIETAADAPAFLTVAEMEPLRIEAGLPVVGKEIAESTLPQELDRNERAISFNKGCYLGQETVARIDARGHVNRLLRGLVVSGDTVPAEGSSIRHGDKEVGQLTSCRYSDRLAQVIGLALLRAGSASPGIRVQVVDGGQWIEATVRQLPFAAKP